MDALSLGKASKVLKEIKQLNDMVVAPLAESRFPTVDARLDWLESQANKIKANNSVEVDFTKGIFTGAEAVNGVLQLKEIITGRYKPSGVYESPVIDLGEGWQVTQLIEVAKQAAVIYSDNLIPAMTNNAAPSGKASASSVLAGSGSYAPYKAFDGSLGESAWLSATLTGWIEYEFPEPHKVTKYTIDSYTNLTSNPKTWTFEAYDGAEWIVLDTRQNITSWAEGVKFEFKIPNDNYYTRYRINVSENNGQSYIGIKEIEMMEDLSGTYCSIDISSSSDGVTFTTYMPLDDVESLPQTRFLKFRASLTATSYENTDNATSNVLYDSAKLVNSNDDYQYKPSKPDLTLSLVSTFEYDDSKLSYYLTEEGYGLQRFTNVIVPGMTATVDYEESKTSIVNMEYTPQATQTRKEDVATLIEYDETYLSFYSTESGYGLERYTNTSSENIATNVSFDTTTASLVDDLSYTIKTI